MNDKITIFEAFAEFHKNNPRVDKYFKRFTKDALRAGHKNYGAKSIMERVRWETNIKTKGEKFKINNNYTCYYARLFEKDFPKHKGFFRKRKLKS